MKKINLRLVDSEHRWAGRVCERVAKRLIATLSADPARLSELCYASARFVDPVRLPESLKLLLNAERTPDQDVPDEQRFNSTVFEIDLRARVVLWSDAEVGKGEVSYLGPRQSLGKLAYQLHESWEIVETLEEANAAKASRDGKSWQQEAPRDVIYGEPLLEFLVDDCDRRLGDIERLVTLENKRRVAAGVAPMFGATRATSTGLDMREAWQELGPDLRFTLAETVHAGWLIRRAPELDQQRVRDVILKDFYHINAEIINRTDQWSEFAVQPRPLRTTDTAYRTSSFGMHELCIYYSLVRSLVLQYISERTRPKSTLKPDRQSSIDWLRIRRDLWLDEPDEDAPNASARELIEQERLRIPLLDAGNPFDCDCPLCNMVADGDELTFRQFAGSHMNSAYPFGLDDWTSDEEEAEREQQIGRNKLVEDALALLFREYDDEKRKADQAGEEAGLLDDGVEPVEYDFATRRFEHGTDFACMSIKQTRDSNGPLFHVVAPIPEGSGHDRADLIEHLREAGIFQDLELPIDKLHPSDGAGKAAQDGDASESQFDEQVWERTGIHSSGILNVDRFTVAACTAELIEDIKTRTNERYFVETLNRYVGNVTSILGDTGQSELLFPVAQRFCDVLDDVRLSFEDLAPKVDDLQARIMSFVDRY